MINRRKLLARMLLWPGLLPLARYFGFAAGSEGLKSQTAPSFAGKKFPTKPYLLSRFDDLERRLAFKAQTQDQWFAWRKEAIATLRRLTGYDTMKRAPLEPAVGPRIDCGDHFRERVLIQTEPGITMPLFVLVPKQGKPPFSPVLALHGHQSRGKAAVIGDQSDPRVAESIRKFNYDYGYQLVKEGFIVFAPDARGFGERLEKEMPQDSTGGSCEYIQKWALPLGQTLAGMWAWDNHRLLDYVQTRPDCKHDKIGCAGLSGGGMQSLYASALDDRITCVVISGYLVGFKEGLLKIEALFCADNVIPGLYGQLNMGDIAALLAPRALLVESGTKDPLYGQGGVGNVIPQVETARKAYQLLGSGDHLRHDVFEGGHIWHGVEAIPWIKKWLTG